MKGWILLKEKTHNMSPSYHESFIPSCTYIVPVSLKSQAGNIIHLPLPQSHCTVPRCRENERRIRRKTTARHLHKHYSTVTSFIQCKNAPLMFSHIFLVQRSTLSRCYPPHQKQCTFHSWKTHSITPETIEI